MAANRAGQTRVMVDDRKTRRINDILFFTTCK